MGRPAGSRKLARFGSALGDAFGPESCELLKIGADTSESGLLSRHRFTQQNDADIRLRPMLDAAAEVLRFTSGRRREGLEADRQLTWALAKAIESMGEATGQLSEETTTEPSNIP